MYNAEDAVFKHLEKLYKDSVSKKEEFQKYWDYYLGNFSDSKIFQGMSNSNNVIKQIIDTKTTLTIDVAMDTSVVSKTTSFQDLQGVKDSRDVADILNDCVKDVKVRNKFDTLKQRVVMNGLVFGMCPVEVIFDPNGDNGGEVKTAIVDPRQFRWEKGCKSVDDASYFIVEMDMSLFQLKKQYAVNPDGTINEEMSDKIDKIAKVQGQKKEVKDLSKPTGVISYQSDVGGGQAYAYGKTATLSEQGKRVILKKIYLKDDSTYAPEQNDSGEIKEGKQLLKYQYPNGRVIIWAGDANEHIILEDKPIDYRFGFPIEVFNPEDVGVIEGHSQVADLMFIQDRINRAYYRLQVLVQKFVSIICYDPGDMDIKEGDLINNLAWAIENMNSRGVPQVVTNNTISEISVILDYINQLKSDAKEIARVNDIMTSGRLPSSDVKSGAMVEALQESPQSSIRAIQRNFREFLIGLTNKIILLIQDYYTVPRIIQLTTGNMAIMPAAQFDEQGNRIPQEVPIIDELGQEVARSKDFAVGQYETEIIAGTEVPRSRTETATLLERLYSTGQLGDMNDLDVKRLFFDAIDLPNRRAIIKMMEEKQQNAAPPPPPPTDKINANLKDLSLTAQAEWYENKGFPKAAEEIRQMQQPIQPSAQPMQEPMPMEVM